MIRVGAITAVPGVIRSLGLDPAQVLTEAGFDLSLFDDPNSQISFAARSRLVGRCAEITGCRHFGLLVGAQGGLHSLGLVGLLVEYSPDVGTALRSLVRFFHHHLRGASIDLVVDGQLAVLDYMIYQPGTEATDQIGDGAMAGAVNIMRGLGGADWSPYEVMLAHRRPAAVEPYRRHFGAPIRFDAEQNVLIFPASWLGHRLAEREPAIRRLLNRIVSHCAMRANCPHFGLLVGQQGGLESLGLMGGLLVKYSVDLQAALDSFVRHLLVHVGGAGANLVVEGRSAILTWEIHEPGVEAIDQVGDGAIAVYYNIFSELCGADWKPTEAWFAHRRPADVTPFRSFFRIPLRFDAEQFALVLPAELLKRRLPEVDAQLRRLLQSEIDVLEERYLGDFSEQVRSVLRTALLTGQLKADHVAGLFGMHCRTLHRRLSASGTGYRQLINESRFAFAKQLLRDSLMDLGEISEVLGYAAPGVFTRPFQRWSGTTPAAWRAQDRHRDAAPEATDLALRINDARRRIKQRSGS